MLMVVAFLVGATTVPLLGGHLTRPESPGLRHWPLIAAALVLQTAAVSVWPTMPRGIAVLSHLASYGLIAVFLVHNRRVAGLWLVALGTAMNGLAIALNGGVMPARAAALRAAGRPASSGEFANSTAMSHPRLAWLGDIAAVPKAIPLANVFSVGDVLIVLGALVVVHQICDSHLNRRRAALRQHPVVGDPVAGSR